MLRPRLLHHEFLVSSVARDRDPVEVEMDLGPVALVALGLAVLAAPGLVAPGSTDHRASMALVPKKACVRVPVRMPRARQWDRDLRDRQWRKGKVVPQVIAPWVIVPQVIVRRRDSIADRGPIVAPDLIIVDREMTVDRDPTEQPLEAADRDLKAHPLEDRDPKAHPLETVDRDLIIVDREMIADLDLIIVDREMTAGPDLIIVDRKGDPPKVPQQFRRPNPPRNKRRSRSLSLRRPNPRRPQRSLRPS